MHMHFQKQELIMANSIKFIGAKVWNALDADLKTLSFRTFKARLKENFTPKLLNQAAKQAFMFSIICKSLMIRLKYAM